MKDLTVKQVATDMQISPETLRRYIRRGLLTTYQLLNGEHRIPQDDLKKFKEGLRG